MSFQRMARLPIYLFLLVALCALAALSLQATTEPAAGASSRLAPNQTETETPTATATITDTATLTPTATATLTDTATLTPTATDTLAPTATNTPAPTATNTPAPTATNTATSTPTDTATPTPTDTATPTPTDTETPTPTDTATAMPPPLYVPLALGNHPLVPTATPTPTYTPSPTASPTPTATPFCMDQYEPNDTFPDAWPWPPATPPPSLNLQARFCPAEQRDYYRFRLASMQNIHALLTNIPVGSDYDIYLYDSNQTYLYGSAHRGNVDEEFTYYDAPPGDYYMLVFVYANPNGTDSYWLRVNSP